MHAHLPGDMGQNLVAIFEFDAEHCVRQRLDHRPSRTIASSFGLASALLLLVILTGDSGSC